MEEQEMEGGKSSTLKTATALCAASHIWANSRSKVYQQQGELDSEKNEDSSSLGQEHTVIIPLPFHKEC